MSAMMRGVPHDAIVSFLREIGLEVVEDAVGDEAFLPGILTLDGRLVVDAARLQWSGDLLHEGGHLAVLSPQERRRFGAVDDGFDLPRVELRAIAWSFAAARHLRMDPAVVFHSGGYRGKGEGLTRTYSLGVYPGAAALEEIGMTLTGERAAAAGVAPYPHMVRWLRV
jgi:hypothetical protein